MQRNSMLLATLVCITACESSLTDPTLPPPPKQYLSTSDLPLAIQQAIPIAQQSDQYIASLEAEFSGTYNRSAIEGSISTLYSPDCNDAFVSLFYQTRQFRQTVSDFWASYFNLISLGWYGGFDWPGPNDVATVVAAAERVKEERVALDVTATFIRSWGCLSGGVNPPTPKPPFDGLQ